MARSRAIVLLVAWYVANAAIYAGWLLHQDPWPERAVGPWSSNHVQLLVRMTFPFFLPPLLLLGRRLMGARRLAFTLAVIGLAAVPLWLVLAFRFHATRRYGFDPFLQAPQPRVPPERVARTTGVFRIVALGGSTTACFWLPEEKRWPTVLEAELAHRCPGTRFEVLNLASPWYTTRHAVIEWTTYARDLRPDLVLYMEAINDVVRSLPEWGAPRAAYDDLYTHYYGPAINAWNPPTFERHLVGRLNGLWFSELRFREIDYPLETYRSIVPFRKNLRALAHYVRSDGAKLALITQPFLYKDVMTEPERRSLVFGQWHAEAVDPWHFELPSARSFELATRAFEDVVREVAREDGLLLVDAEPRVPKTLEHFKDDVHATEAGARIVAEAVAEAIAGAGIVGGR